MSHKISPSSLHMQVLALFIFFCTKLCAASSAAAYTQSTNISYGLAVSQSCMLRVFFFFLSYFFLFHISTSQKTHLGDDSVHTQCTLIHIYCIHSEPLIQYPLSSQFTPQLFSPPPSVSCAKPGYQPLLHTDQQHRVTLHRQPVFHTQQHGQPAPAEPRQPVRDHHQPELHAGE